jgi:hypothetical protein
MAPVDDAGRTAGSSMSGAVIKLRALVAETISSRDSGEFSFELLNSAAFVIAMSARGDAAKLGNMLEVAFPVALRDGCDPSEDRVGCGVPSDIISPASFRHLRNISQKC